MPKVKLPSRTFGIEIEHTTSVGATSMREYVREVVAPLGGHVTGDCYIDGIPSGEIGWSVTTDGGGLEVRTPPITHRHWPEVAAVLEMLKSHGGRITRSDGMHVHHDISDFSFRNLPHWALLWSSLESGIINLIPRYRRNWSACQLLGPSRHNFEQMYREAELRHWSYFQTIGRYALNPYCGKYGTTEIRLHHGSLNLKKMRFWVMFIQSLLSYAKRSDNIEQYRVFKDMTTEQKLNQLFAISRKHTPEWWHAPLRLAIEGRVNKHSPDLRGFALSEVAA